MGLLNFAPAKLGYTGVAFFFVLSGFLLAWTDRQDQSAGQFYLRRVARIYPSHIAMMAVVLCFPTGQEQDRLLPTILNVLLVQAWAPDFAYAYSINGVAWSLSCEVFFYLLFPLLVSSLRGKSVTTLALVGFGIFGLVNACVLISTTVDVSPSIDAVRYTNPLVRLPEFVLGVCASLAIQQGWKPRPWMGLVLVLIAGCGIAAVSDKPAGDVWGALLYLTVIVSFVRLDCTRSMKFMRAKSLIYAGEISFAFYLVHQWVLIQSVEILGATLTAGGISFVASVGLAVCLHHGVERTANRAILVRFSSRAQKRQDRGVN